jgi:acetyl/propionyl-CoA carboxylase alpha subunit
MLKVKVNGKTEHRVELEGKNTGKINGENFSVDLIKVKAGIFSIIKDDKSYNVEVVKTDKSTKTFTIKVNGNKYDLEVKDQFDELLKKLGMENLNAGKVNEIKAPMPGLVIDILVQPGSEVKKGDAIMVLEAMKMENILKSPSDGVVKKVNVEKKQAVEKNQVLVNFE